MKLLLHILFLIFTISPSCAKDENARVLSLNKLPGWPDSTDYAVYSGYIDLGNTGKSIYYFFAESQTNPQKDPLIVWYNGGPGCSSMFGLY